MATDLTFTDRYLEAVLSWAALHPTVTWEDLAAGLDEAPDAEAIEAFLVDPEHPNRAAPIE